MNDLNLTPNHKRNIQLLLSVQLATMFTFKYIKQKQRVYQYLYTKSDLMLKRSVSSYYSPIQMKH